MYLRFNLYMYIHLALRNYRARTNEMPFPWCASPPTNEGKLIFQYGEEMYLACGLFVCVMARWGRTQLCDSQIETVRHTNGT